MRKFTVAAAVIALSLMASDAWARGGGGGGGRGGAGGGARGFSGGDRGGDFRGGPGDFRGRAGDFGGGIGAFGGGVNEVGGVEGRGVQGRALEGRGVEGRGVEGRGVVGEARPIAPQVIHPEAAGRGVNGVGGEAGRNPARNDAAARVLAGQPGKAGNPAERATQRTDRFNEVNRQVGNHRNDFNNLFTHDFFHNNPHPHWVFRGEWDRWWGTPAWGALAAWGAWGWGEPIPYNYGNNVYYDGDTVYDDGEAVATSQEYAQQAENIATDVPKADPDKVEWMPLGVFALSMDEAKGPEPTIYLQLAVSNLDGGRSEMARV
ncbi:MAG: hypothetical protein K8T91_09125 [Planctomycetes bacterium]|nr:hypothetical protein [Planctomycetota bacterium]